MNIRLAGEIFLAVIVAFALAWLVLGIPWLIMKDEVVKKIIREEQAEAVTTWLIKYAAEKGFIPKTPELRNRLSKALVAALEERPTDYMLCRGGLHKSFDNFLEDAISIRMDIICLQDLLPPEFQIVFYDRAVQLTIGDMSSPKTADDRIIIYRTDRLD